MASDQIFFSSNYFQAVAEDTGAVEVTGAGAEAGQDTEVAAVEAGAGAGLLELGAEVSWSSNIFFCLT